MFQIFYLQSKQVEIQQLFIHALGEKLFPRMNMKKREFTKKISLYFNTLCALGQVGSLAMHVSIRKNITASDEDYSYCVNILSHINTLHRTNTSYLT